MLPAPLGALDQPIDPEQQLLQIKRFGQIVVQAVGQPLDPVIRSAFGRKNQNRQPFVLEADRLENRQPVKARQHDVENDQIRGERLPFLHTAGAVFGDIDFIPLELQVQGQPLGNVKVVFDDENFFLLRHRAMFPGPMP